MHVNKATIMLNLSISISLRQIRERKKIFEAKVIQVGPEAQNMIQDANMLILFGEEAPEDLAEYCFKIDNKNLLGSILEGGKLVVDNQEYSISSVGNVVEKNLTGLDWAISRFLLMVQKRGVFLVHSMSQQTKQ